MNNSRLCALIVMVAIISPCIVGFVWPSEQGETTTQVIGTGSNISSDLFNGAVSVFDNYTDPYNNNAYVISDTVTTYLPIPAINVVPNAVTSTSSPIPYYSTNYTQRVVMTDEDGFYVVDPVEWASDYPDAAIIIWSDYMWSEIDVAHEGEVASFVIYYPASNQMYFTDGIDFYGTQSKLSQTTVEPFYLVSTPNTAKTVYFAKNSNAQYADLTAGFEFPFGAHWYNGFTNRSIDILLKVPANSTNEAAFRIYDNNYHDSYLGISADSAGNITYKLAQSGLANKEGSIGGTATTYPYVLVNFDYTSKTINISGLIGMSSFLDDYQSHIRKTTTIQWDYATEFTSIMTTGAVSSGDTGKFSWYVPQTIAAISTVQGIRNNSINFNNYDGENGQIQLAGVQYWPTVNNSFRILINGTDSYYGSVDGAGMLHMTINGANHEWPINDLVITQLGKAVFINGTSVIEYPDALTSVQVFFNDSWFMNVYYWPIIDRVDPSYSWSPGGFGLDIAGFCLVGLIASLGVGVAALLYGRRSGSKAALVLITVGCCAGFYLAILMNPLF